MEQERRILKSQKNVFWEALIIAVFIFGIGILLGVYIENGRAKETFQLYLQSDINLLDTKIQTEIFNLKSFDCEKAIQSNIDFGTQIFNDAVTLERYEGANRISDLLKQQHKEYDLLRTLFWVNAIKIKEKCGSKFHTLVYLYNYDSSDRTEKNTQQAFSNALIDIKSQYGDNLLLIPIAKNMDITSLDIIVSQFNISKVSVILDEKLVVSDLNDLDKIREALA